MMRLPNTVLTPPPEPATPTVAATAPMNLAAVWMSLEMALVLKLRLGKSEVRGNGAAKLLRLSSVSVPGGFRTTGPLADSDRLNSSEALLIKKGLETNSAQADIFGDEGLWQESCSQCREDWNIQS